MDTTKHSLRINLIGLIVIAIIAVTVSTSVRAAGGTIDPSFSPGLLKLKAISRIAEEQSDPPHTDWQPGLRLLIGVKAVEASRQTVSFVELTTLRPASSNAPGHPWKPAQQTNTFGWTDTNKVRSAAHTALFISTLYPVGVRVFDQDGHVRQAGEAKFPWVFLTNVLAYLCHLDMEFFRRDKNAVEPDHSGEEPFRVKVEENASPQRPDPDKAMRTLGSGFIWMATMLQQIRTVPAVHDLWKQAHCSFRLPEVSTLALGVVTGDFNISIEPKFDQVSLDGQTQQYKLPVDLNSGNRNLTRAELVIGPATGAEMLLGGIRSIRAVHPTKPQQQFFVQILAAGKVP